MATRFFSFYCTFVNKAITLVGGYWNVQPKCKLILVKLVTIVLTKILKMFKLLVTLFKIKFYVRIYIYN